MHDVQAHGRCREPERNTPLLRRSEHTHVLLRRNAVYCRHVQHRAHLGRSRFDSLFLRLSNVPDCLSPGSRISMPLFGISERRAPASPVPLSRPQRAALYWIYHYHLKSRVREKLKKDEVVARRGFHDHYRLCAALRLNLMELFLCELHAGYVVVDFCLNRTSFCGLRTYRSLKRLLTSMPATGTGLCMKQPPMRDNILVRELTCACETRVSGRAAPIQPKRKGSRRMNGLSTLRVIPQKSS